MEQGVLRIMEKGGLEQGAWSREQGAGSRELGTGDLRNANDSR